MSSTAPFATVSEVLEKPFDYIICGGGTAGLTLAARLTEDPNISVLVLDAGKANLNDPAILLPAQYGRHFLQDQYDWKFFTAPQKHAAGRRFLWSRGKSLGGSSSINFLIYMRPPEADVNEWEELGNPGWNWENHLKYMKRGEKITPPSAKQAEVNHQTYEPAYHGTEGTLEVGFPTTIMGCDVPLQETMHKVGMPIVKDSMGGNVNGTWMSAASIRGGVLTRSYAANAFYSPFADRPNYKVLPEAHVNKIIFVESADDGQRTAEGVEFTHDGQTYVAKTAKEVIVSAGCIQSPQILELSGIGNPEILKPLGIDTIVPLPGVGSNVQEHLVCGVVVELDPAKEGGWKTLTPLRAGAPDFVQLQQKLFETQQGLHTLGISNLTFAPFQKVSPAANELIANLSKKLEEDYKEGRISEGLWEQYQIQLRGLKDEGSVDMEFAALPYVPGGPPPDPKKEYLTILVCLNRLYSRGTIHINSTDPKAPPVCDPNYFENEFDMQMMIEGLKFVRNLETLEPFKSQITQEIAPGPNVQTYEQLREYVISKSQTTFHTAGSCSMLPQEKGGVVDPKLKVYGTTNVRVVDLSIMPLHVNSHPLASVYGIAEQAADVILGKI